MILGSALMMLTVGCTTDTTKEVVNNDNKVIIGLSVDDTRTSLGDKSGTEYPVLWSAGDKVAVNGVASEPLAAEYAGKTAAQFTVTGVAAPFDVIYPADVLMADGTVGISEIQEYVAGSFAQGSAVMVGHSDSPNGVIKNLYGFVKVPILKGDEKTVKSVTLHSNNLEAMTGTFAVDYVNAALEPLSGMDFVKVTAAEGIPFVEDKAEVVIAVPAGTYANGFTVKIVATDGTAMTKKAYEANGITIDAGTLLAMPDVEFYPNETVSEITDAAQLQAFLSAASAGAYDNFKNENGEVLLGSDIDMTGVTLTSATQFDGVFNGQGYALKNWKSDGTTIFAVNNGTVKNVVLDESCELNQPAEIGGDFGFIVSTNNNMVSGCANNADVKLLNGSFSAAANMGILVGYSPAGAHVQNCINNGDLQISATGNAAGTCYIGTVQGRLASSTGADTEISNCINNGNISITITDDTTSKNFYIGGVTGSSNSGTKTTGCINHGDITFTTESSGAAVIIGGVTSYSAQAITDCFNSGAITLISKSQIKGTLIGGIAGYQHGAIKGCENTGDIELSATHFGGRNSIGDLDGTASTSTTCNGMGGVVGQSTASFSMDNCKNSGNIKAYYGNMASSTLTSAGRFVYGGLVGDAWGDISNSDNAGSLNIVMTSNGGTFTGKNAGATIYTGGIAGSGYYSKNQTELNITNCHNTGDLYMRSDNTHTTNHTCGGIVGWPGKESGCTAVTKDCSNTGNITVEGNIKARVGGIQGGSGRIENCINRGIITANCGSASAVGGIAGFHSNSYQLANCENYGNMVSQKDNIFVAGLIGQFGNVDNHLTTGCKVNCTVQAPADSIAGMLVASFSGNGNDKTGEKYVISIGTEAVPCQVAGKLIIGSTETTITAAELTKQYMFGASAYQNDHDLFVTLLQ